MEDYSLKNFSDASSEEEEEEEEKEEEEEEFDGWSHGNIRNSDDCILINIIPVI